MSQDYNAESTLEETIPPAHYPYGNTIEGQPRHAIEELKDRVEEETIPSLERQHVPTSTDKASADVEKNASCVQDSHYNIDIPSVSRSPSKSNAIPLTSVDARGNVYPEGGPRAWLVVYGSFSGMTASFGLMNTIGTYQAYLSKHQLSYLDPSTIGWIFSIYTFLSFFGGVQFGPIFDAKGPRVLMLAGTVCLVGGAFAIAESTSKCPLGELFAFALDFESSE